MPRAIVVFLVVCLAAVEAAAAEKVPFRYSCEGERCAVENGTPYRFALLMVERRPDGTTRTETVFVDGHQTAVPKRVSGETVSIADAQLLEPAIRIEPGNRCGSTRIGVPLTAAAEQSEIAAVAARSASKVDVLSTPEATRAREATKELAMLELDNRLDALRAEKWDRFLGSLQEDLYSDSAAHAATKYDIARQQTENFQQDFNDHLNELTAMAEAYMQISDMYLDQLGNQADRLEPHARNAAEKRGSLEDALADAARRTRVGREFSIQVSRAFSTRGVTPASVRVLSGLARPCGEPTLAEVVEIAAEASADVNVLAGRLKFDRGGAYDVAFRRMGNSNQWRTTVYWPVEATRLSATVRTYGGRSPGEPAGDLRLGSMSYEVALKTTARELKDIEKSYKKARFRSKGGDGVKTMRIP